MVLGGGCVWDVFLSGLTAGEGSGMVFRAAALVVVWLAGSAGWFCWLVLLAGSAGWFWDRGFVVSGLVW
ncbi:hypothetical protein OYC59_000585 [Cutibacterium acnes]|uniref:hypothetical protein n=1 Tax=Cutibacterium acnes TaxID=1747 RepID=UPI00244B0E72|nr:hypothetical protein [Cutibacterium acnes]WGH35448.1 hypothetical protein OYC59_000585 [Cutibacterium acnes]